MIGGLKAFIPGTARYSEKHHIKYLKKKARGHDVLLFVEWADGQVTEIPGDYHPERDGWYVTPMGLMFANLGEGVDPSNYYGVPLVRCHAQIACPISTTAAIQAEYDEAGEFTYHIKEYDDGTETTKKVVEEREHVVEIEVEDDGTEEPDGSVDPIQEPVETDGSDDPLATDGGVPASVDEIRERAGDVLYRNGDEEVITEVETETREYDIQPPAPAVGHAFGLNEVAQRAPNPVTPNLLSRAFNYGKETARDQSHILKVAAGAAVGGLVLALVVVGFLWLLGQLGGSGGGGSGGGGGGIALGLLPILAGPGARAALKRHISGEDE